MSVYSYSSQKKKHGIDITGSVELDRFRPVGVKIFVNFIPGSHLSKSLKIKDLHDKNPWEEPCSVPINLQDFGKKLAKEFAFEKTGVNILKSDARNYVKEKWFGIKDDVSYLKTEKVDDNIVSLFRDHSETCSLALNESWRKHAEIAKANTIVFVDIDNCQL